MLSKLFTRLNHSQNMTQMATRAFRMSPQMNKKPSIGDAVTILQAKVSNISQVVSSFAHMVRVAAISIQKSSTHPMKYSWPLTVTIRTILKSSVLWSQLVMVLLESSALPRSKLERWSSSAPASRVWPLTWKLTTSVSSSSVTIGKQSHIILTSSQRNPRRWHCQKNWHYRRCPHRFGHVGKSRWCTR